MSKREENRQRWAKVVHRFYQSGLSAYRFAKREDISLTSLQYWKKRIPPENAIEFLPVQCSELVDRSSLGPVTLEIPGGSLFHFSQHASPEALARFAAALTALTAKA